MNGSPISLDTKKVSSRSGNGRDTIITVPLKNGKVRGYVAQRRRATHDSPDNMLPLFNLA